MEETLKSLGNLGLLTCYRIMPFIVLLNRNSINYKYEFKQMLGKDKLDYFEIYSGEDVCFTADEWGNLTENKTKKENEEKVKEDLLRLRMYMVKSIFRTIAYKFSSYNDLNLNVYDFYNGVVTPVFLELYNFYDLDFKKVFKELEKNKIEVKKLLKKKELDIKVTDSKNILTIKCGDNSITMPKIKLDIKTYNIDYKGRCMILDHLGKYWIFGQRKESVFMLLDPFNLGQPMQFFSEYLVYESILNGNNLMQESKLNIPKTAVEGNDEVLFEIAGHFGAALFKNFMDIYSRRF
jgi:hypothetical protein